MQNTLFIMSLKRIQSVSTNRVDQGSGKRTEVCLRHKKSYTSLKQSPNKQKLGWRGFLPKPSGVFYTHRSESSGALGRTVCLAILEGLHMLRATFHLYGLVANFRL